MFAKFIAVIAFMPAIFASAFVVRNFPPEAIEAVKSVVNHFEHAANTNYRDTGSIKRISYRIAN